MPSDSIPIAGAAMSGTQHRRALYARWACLLDSILPPPDGEPLVSVAEVGSGSLPLLKESLAAVGLTPVVSEARAMNGQRRYRVQVPAADADAAEQAVAGI